MLFPKFPGINFCTNPFKFFFLILQFLIPCEFLHLNSPSCKKIVKIIIFLTLYFHSLHLDCFPKITVASLNVIYFSFIQYFVTQVQLTARCGLNIFKLQTIPIAMMECIRTCQKTCLKRFLEV